MSLNLLTQNKIQEDGICISVGSEPIYTYSSEPKVNCSQTIKLENKIEKREDEKSMKPSWEKIMKEYELKTLRKLREENEKNIKEVVLKDPTVVAIVDILHKKEEEFKKEKDSIVNDFYMITNHFMGVVDITTDKAIDAIIDSFQEKCSESNNKIAEIKAVLEMTETYEQMKEVLIQYGVLNWNEEK